MARTLGDAFLRVRPDTAHFPAELRAGVNRGGPAKVPVVADTSKLEPGINSGVQKAQRGFGSRLGGFAKVAGVALGAAGAYGAVQFTKGAVKLEADFGRTMNVLAATTGAPQKQMRQLSALALKMGADTVFSAQDAAGAMLELARGGMTPATIQGGALKATLTLAAAGGMSMADAANASVKAMGAFQLHGKQAGSVAAALAGAANASAASVSDMSQALTAGGLAAANVGFSIQETTGILAAFSNAGLNGSDAGTSLKTMLANLTPQTTSATNAFKRLGLITEDGKNRLLNANGTYKSAAQIAGLLQKGTEHLTVAQRNQALTQAFGSDATRAATILSREGADGIRKYTKATSDQGAAQKMAAANMKGTAGALEAMHGSIETAQLAWGQAIKPVTLFGARLVTVIANGAVPIIQDFGRILRKNLANVDLSGLQRGLRNFDIASVFDRVRDSLRGIDWGSASGGLKSIAASVKGADWGAFGKGFGKGTSDAVSVFSVVIGYAADHIGTLARLMPLLIAGFVAYKAAQVASNAASIVHLPLQVATIASNVLLAGSQRALATQLAVVNGRERVTMLTRVRGTAVAVAQRVATVAVSAATRAYAAVQWVLNAALRANPIGLVITALFLLGAGLVAAYKKSETFRRIVNGAWHGIQVGAAAVGHWFSHTFFPFFTDKLPAVFRGLIGWVRGHWPIILAILTGPIGLAVLGIVRNWGRITGAFRDAVGWARAVFKRGWSALQGYIASPVQQGRALVSRALDAIQSGFRSAVGAIGRIWSGLQGAAKKPVQFIVNTVYNAGLRPALNKIPGVHLKPAHFARGGPVWGGVGGLDSVDAKLMPGEHVWTALEVAKAGGHRAMRAMRKAVQRFARGGPVWPTVGRRVSTYPGHDGVDINQPPGPNFGAPIYAWRSGRISYTGWGRGYGDAIFERAPGFPEVVYGHASRVRVRAGQQVSAGQTIGNVGSTGNSSGPHLHFGHPGGTSGLARALLRGAGYVGSSGGYPGAGTGSYTTTSKKYPNFKSPFPGILGKVAGWANALRHIGPWGSLMAAVPKAIVAKVVSPVGVLAKKVASALAATIKRVVHYAGAGPTSGGQGTAQWAPTVRQVLIALHQSPALLGKVLRRMSQESGGNPRAVNRTDSNARAGHPSTGLMQVIRGTYAAYRPHPDHGPFMNGVSINPFDNIYAGLNYARHRYGSIAYAMDKPGGYDRGGRAVGRGYMVKDTLRPERVLSPRQTEAFERLVELLERGGVGGGRELVHIDNLNARDEAAAMRAAMTEARKAMVMMRLAP